VNLGDGTFVINTCITIATERGNCEMHIPKILQVQPVSCTTKTPAHRREGSFASALNRTNSYAMQLDERKPSVSHRRVTDLLAPPVEAEFQFDLTRLSQQFCELRHGRNPSRHAEGADGRAVHFKERRPAQKNRCTRYFKAIPRN